MLFNTETQNHYTGTNTTGIPYQPYIVCSTTEGLSGLEREEEVVDIFHLDAYVSVLVNQPSSSCFIAGLYIDDHHHLSEIDPEMYPYIKLTPLMKLRSGLTALKNNSTDDSDASGEKVIMLQLCPFMPEPSEEAMESDNLKNFFGLESAEDMNLLEIPYLNDTFVDALEEKFGVLPDFITKIVQIMGSDSAECENVMFDSMIVEMSSAKDIMIRLVDDTPPSCVVKLAMSLAERNELCSIERRQPAGVSNTIGAWIVQSGTNGYTPWYDIGLNGTGEIVTVSDSGLDTNNCYFWDSSPGEFYNKTYQPERRKVVYYDAYKDNTDTYNGHGTHVSGTVAGLKSIDGIEESVGMADGIAKAAKLAFFDMGLGSTCCYTPGTNRILGKAYDNTGSRIHSASWGTIDSTYSSTASSFDDYISSNDDLLLVVAAGNYGSVNSTRNLASPGTAKNVLTVGATDSEGSDLYNGMLGSDYLAYFSSRGPTSDGRIKPDIVSPGFNILSAGSRPSAVGECDPVDPSLIPSANVSTTISGDYGLYYSAGTSMATPIVSGTAALVRQYFSSGFYPTGEANVNNTMTSPSAALMKAVLINGASSLLGVDDGSGVLPVADYDVNQGHGRVHLLRSLPLAYVNDISVEVYDRQTITNGDSHNYTFAINGTCCLEELSVTLVWTDPAAAAGCAQCLVNDLDLSLKDSFGNIHNANGLINTTDTFNNVERIRVPAADGDNFVVFVNGTNMASLAQNYSLVVTGCFNDRDNIGEGEFGCFTPPKLPTTTPSLAPTISVI